MLALLLIFFSLSAAGQVFAVELAEPKPESLPAVSTDPVVPVRPPKSYNAKKFFLLPLEIPSYVLKGVTYPLLELGKLLERHPGIFSFEERNWLIVPLIEAGGGDGFGGGLFFQYRNLFDKGYQLRLYYQVHTDLDQRAFLVLDSPPVEYLWDRPIRYQVRVDFRNNPNARFYGRGSDSLQSDKSEYGLDRVRGGGHLDYQILSRLKVKIPVDFMTVNTRSAKGNARSVEDTFPASEIPGFDKRLTYFITGLELKYDTTDSEVTPTRGGSDSFQFLRYQGLSHSGFDFNEYFLDLRQYVALWTPRHVLAFRNAWKFQQGTGDSQVPFVLFSELDWKQLLRGFDRGRFRDNSYVLFNFEYRFPIWDFIDGKVFLDTGKVFRASTDVSFDHWKYAAGGGISFILRDLVLFTVEVGYGGEGPRAVFRVGPSI